jgi:hypothetical protein
VGYSSDEPVLLIFVVDEQLGLAEDFLQPIFEGDFELLLLVALASAVELVHGALFSFELPLEIRLVHND